MAALNLGQIRQVVEATWQEVAGWFSAKPRIFTLPHPEQQVLFEFAARLRDSLRAVSQQPSWDRLYFDGSAVSLGTATASYVAQRPPIYVDTRRLFGLPDHAPRQESTPDLAIAIQVLRSAPAVLRLAEDGRPENQRWMPVSIDLQGWLLEEHVAQLEELSASACDGYLFVVYSNEASRRTAVDTRDVASWASWHQPGPNLWWASRHFRAHAQSQPPSALRR